MLQFFRKYQKIVFFFVTIVVVISFCFFGTYGTLNSKEKIDDKQISTGMMGKPIFAREHRALRLLLSSSFLDQDSKEGLPNLMNPGIVERDFLATGLGAILVKPYFSQMKQELDQRAKKIQSYRPYQHPHSLEVGLEKLYSLVSPSFLPSYVLLKARSDQATMETWILMSRLYLEQAILPPAETIRQFLFMQEQQLGLAHDENLQYADLSLFGFKNLEDWFGPQFLTLVTNTILHVAQLAEDRGYQISSDEARQHIFSSIQEGYQRLLRKKEISASDVQKYYVGKIRALGLDEETLLKSWKKVMIFERIFNEVGQSVYLDPLALEQFGEFVQEKRMVDLYTLPSHLQFKDFLSLCQFQLYLESISKEGASLRKSLDLPERFLSVAEVQKKVPELIRQAIEIEWRSVSIQEVQNQLSLQEILSWQETHWKELKEKFPLLLKGEDLFEVLPLLTKEQRKEVDLYSQEKMVAQNPARIQSALAEKSLLPLSGNLSLESAFFSRLHVQNEEILKLLQEASFKQEVPNQAACQLKFYSPDSKNFYEIVVLKRDSSQEILTFKEAMKEGICDRMLTKLLEKTYPEIRKKNPAAFQTKEGTFKQLDEVKEVVARHLFSDLVQTLSKESLSPETSKEEDLFTRCATLRWVRAIEQVQKRLIDHESSSLSFYATEDNPLAKEFALERKSQMISRSSSLFNAEELFAKQEGEWSSVQRGIKGLLGFYQIQGKEQETAIPLEETKKGHEILSEDAKRNFMTNLLKRLHQEEKIDLLAYAD